MAAHSVVNIRRIPSAISSRPRYLLKLETGESFAGTLLAVFELDLSLLLLDEPISHTGQHNRFALIEKTTGRIIEPTNTTELYMKGEPTE